MKDNNILPVSNDEPSSLDLLQAALDSTITGVIITDNRLRDNPIIFCNTAFSEMSGYSRDEIIGRNCRFLQADERDQPARPLIREAVDQGKSIKVEVRNYRKDGQLFWNELYISPIKNKSGIVTHFIGVQHDITRRKQVELILVDERKDVERKVEERSAQLKESQEYLESIVQTIRQGLLVLDANSIVISANDFFLKTFKVEKRDTIGKSLYSLGNGQWNIQQLKVLLEQILPTNNPVLNFEVEHEFPHIGKKLMLLNAHRVELEGQFKDRVLLAIEDITDLRAAEVRKDDFLSVSSHELKTPLTTIKGYNQTIAKLLPKDVNPKLSLLVEKMGKQIDRFYKIITNLLDMSRIQTGNLVLQQEAVDLHTLIREAVETFNMESTSHQIIINGDLTVRALGDESQLSQVMLNLISNAVKYSPGAASIEIQLSKVSNFTKISVTDFGMGINSQDQKRIFDRFFRTSNVQRHFPGMGIGLYITEEIITKHGGRLWVDSEEGKGATFSFTIPLYTPDAKND